MTHNLNEKTAADQQTVSTVMIFGSGACAHRLADNLVKRGLQVWLVSTDGALDLKTRTGKLTMLKEATLSSCRGFAGCFHICLKQGDALVEQTVAAIVVAEDLQWHPNFKIYGLTPADRVVSFSWLEKQLAETLVDQMFKPGTRIAFFNGWENQSHPVTAARMLQICLQCQEQSGVDAFFFTGNLKVAANGSERCYQAAKNAGAVFVKSTGPWPVVRQSSKAGVTIDYVDELTGSLFKLTADWVVVDEHPDPAAQLIELADKLNIETDAAGFAQDDNVHRLSNTTNRRGVFVAGTSRDVLSTAEQMADADQVALQVVTFLQDNDRDAPPKVEIQRGRCARCLTCLRLCPHTAVKIGHRIQVVPQACFGCGICAGGCPAKAINVDGVSIGAELKQVARRYTKTQEGSARQVVVFGCSRSAGRAAKLARTMGAVLPEGVRFVEVPCGGTLSSRHLLAAFDAGAHGVMLCTCHTDNCKSRVGNAHAFRRAGIAREVITAVGEESERLCITTVAANMGVEFIRFVEAFAQLVGSFNSNDTAEMRT